MATAPEYTTVSGRYTAHENQSCPILPGTGVSCVPSSGPLVACPKMFHALPVSFVGDDAVSIGRERQLIAIRRYGRKYPGSANVPAQILTEPASNADAVPGVQNTTMSSPATDARRHHTLLRSAW